MKRLITLFAAVAFAGQAWAEIFDFSAVCGTGQTLYYKITSNTEPYTVAVTYPSEVDFVGYAGYTAPEGDLVIPTEVENDGVTYLVTSIDTSAFINCSSLTSVTIPNSVTSIESDVFSGCSLLQSLIFPYVYKQPFGYIFGESKYEGAIATDQEEIVEKMPDYQVYKRYWFYIPSTLKSVTVNGGIIAYGAFSNCNGLSTIIIGDSVTNICEQAFVNCKNLTSVVIGDSVESIGEDAFSGCSSLTSVVIGESVDSVGSWAFRGCDSLSSVIIKGDVNLSYSELWIKKDGVQYRVKNKNTVSVDSVIWDDYDYSGDIIIPATVIAGNTFYVKSIASYAFNYDSITSITIPNSVTKIGEWAFSNCQYLTSITIPNSVVSIGNSAFKGCSSLTSVTIPETVTSIGNSAFKGCSSLTSITIPISVTEIGKNAFAGCNKLTINCEVSSKPSGWDSDWFGEYYKGTVVWAGRTPINETAANAVNIYAYGKNIVVENAAEEIRVYDAMGRLVCRDVACRVRTINIKKTGVYIVKVGNIAKRVAIN